MEGKKLLDTLSKIEGGELYDIFNLLPDSVGGEAWLLEIQYTAQRVGDYIEAEEDYSLEDLRELGHEYATDDAKPIILTSTLKFKPLVYGLLDEVERVSGRVQRWRTLSQVSPT
jgi:hypothetical protein